MSRLLARLPVAIALVFGFYSLGLFAYTYQAWQRTKAETDAFIVADSQRRALTVADRASELIAETERLADLHEIHAYLVNRDLGMSLRYGLNASLQALEERFLQLAARARGTLPPRLLYVDPAGEVLADTTPGVALPALARPPHAGVRLDVVENEIVIAVPVRHREARDGAVAAAYSLQRFYRGLMGDEAADGYREVLLSEGRELYSGAPSLPQDLLVAYAEAQEDRVLRSSELVPGADLAAGLLVVKTQVPGLPLTLLTLLPEERAHGRLADPLALTLIGLVPFLLFLAALWFDRLRVAGERLREDVRVSEERRRWAEERNLALEHEVARRERVEHALAESEERWALAVEGTNDGIWDWDIRSGNVFFSPRWLSMIGYAPGELPGRVETWQQLMHPEDARLALEKLQAHLRGESEHYDVEFRLHCKAGDYKWIRGRGKVQRGLAGEPLRMAGSHTDISERREAEASARDRTEQLNAIFALSPDGFVSFDAERRAKYANPAFLRMTGLLEGELVGLDEESFGKLLGGLCNEGSGFPGFGRLRKVGAGETAAGHGTRHVLELRGPGRRVLEMGLRQAQAETVSQILYFRDITHESEVDRMKSEFLSHAAHELRTPMASVLGFAEVLKNPEIETTDAEREEFLTAIHRNAELMAKIIDELLDLARIEARRGKDFRLTRLELGDLLDRVVADFHAPPGREKPVLENGGEEAVVVGDRDKLAQAVNNVLSNAYKYSPEGGEVEASLLLESGEDAKPAQIGVRIRDVGMGMSQEQLARVCERFYRADTSGRIPGTGLGMSLVKEIVELHGGRVEIASKVGHGTTVTLWLPAVREVQ